MLGTVALAGAIALASAQWSAPQAPENHIYGGSEVDACGWPSTVYLQSSSGACTGVLVHPLVVMTAAHCIDEADPSSVRFGESGNTAQALVQTAYCRQGPGWTGATATGQDYGYCRLKAPVTSVPIVPVASGCEQTAIQPGATIMHVGFGTDENGNSGRKKMLETTIDEVGGGEILSGEVDEIICNGDSGGPTFVYLDPALGGDGSWRVAAIHSWAQGADPVSPNCTGVAGSVLASQAIDWIEQDSGIDITPCTDGDSWSPTAHCGGMPTRPWIASGTYTTACESPDTIEFAGVCGPALDATPDTTPPQVVIATPTTQQQFESGGDAVPVDVELQVADAGWGVHSVELTIRSVTFDQEQVESRNEWQSWVFSADLPPGSYEVVAVATDYAGNTSDPVTVCFGVDEPGCGEGEDPGDDTGDDAGSTGDDPEPSGTTGDEPDNDDDDDGDDTAGDTDSSAAVDDPSRDGGGCRIAPVDSRSPMGWLWILPVLFRRRERR